MSKVEVHLPELIHASQLAEHPRNSNKQSRHMYGELRESIRENGFDETLTVVPRDDDSDGYYIVAGNHRFRAGRAEGMKDFPCVVRDDWDEVQQQVELVRRNYVRGAIDKNAFTIAVDALVSEQELSIEEVQEAMGFEDHDFFLDYYKEENERQEKAQAAAAAHIQNSGSKSSQIQMVDDLGLILSAIFEQHGDTVPYSFVVFPAGQQNHLFVAATPALVHNLTRVAEYCVINHMDINVILGGLLTIGMDQAKMFTEDQDLEETETLGRKGIGENPASFSRILPDE
jgi:hypothetical protein